MPFSPGGSSDLVARLVGKESEKYFGQPMVIENKPGAGAMIGLNELVVFGEKRLTDPLFKDAPTAREKGYDVVVTLWQGIGAPKNLPEPVRARLEEGLGKMLASPEMREQIRNLGLEPVYLDGNAFGKKWLDENAHYRSGRWASSKPTQPARGGSSRIRACRIRWRCWSTIGGRSTSCAKAARHSKVCGDGSAFNGAIAACLPQFAVAPPHRGPARATSK